MNAGSDTQNNIPEKESASDFRAKLAKMQVEDSSTESMRSDGDLRNEPELANHNEPNPETMEDTNSDSQQSLEVEGVEEEQDSNLPNMIPRGRFKQVIEKRKEVESQLQKEREERIRVETQMAMLTDALQKLNSNPSAGTSYESQPSLDPLDSEAHQFYMHQFAKQQEVLEKEREERGRMVYKQQMQYALANQEAEFTKEAPDFREAYEYLIGVQTDAFKNFYTPEQAHGAAMNYFGGMAEQILGSNKNVAKTFYDMAKRYGYNAGKPSNKPSPNLSAINNNMKKSATADINSASLPLGNGRSNVATREVFEKEYDGSAKKFQELLKALERGL